jgi:hypothetical protein
MKEHTEEYVTEESLMPQRRRSPVFLSSEQDADMVWFI